jgi:N-acetylglucosamine kinase-like BadF-type ATPase
LGDEGSGYDLVMRALQRCTCAADGRGPSTALLDLFLHRLSLAKPSDLIGAVHSNGLNRSALAALAPVVFNAAAAGDIVATMELDEGARQLALAVVAAADKLGIRRQSLPLALAGGLLLNFPSYVDKTLTQLSAAGLHVEPVTLVREPAEGAVRIALAKGAGGSS